MAFVHETLFSFARDRVRAWVERQAGTDVLRGITRQLVAEHAEDAQNRAESLPPWQVDSKDAERASVVAYVHWLMARDRKSPGLKTLQGFLWEEGYQAGVLRGVVYADVPRALRRWQAARLRVAIYSSGSELAQRRLFESTDYGDLTPGLSGFFDTRVGSKVEAASYRRIAEVMDVVPSEMLFVSDVTRELSAAIEAGCDTCLIVRSGNAAQADASRFHAVASLDDVIPAPKKSGADT